MDSLITAAARALAAGDPLGALKRVALRDDSEGLPRETLLGRVDDLSVLWFSGLLAHRPRNAFSLETMLAAACASAL